MAVLTLNETDANIRRMHKMAPENEDTREGRNAPPRDAGSVQEGRVEGQDSDAEIVPNLKSVGTDTDRLTEAAGERVSELQRLVIEEVRAQPLRALAWAAAAGVIVGLWAAR